MTDPVTVLQVAGPGLLSALAIAAVAWIASLPLRDVSVVDSAWSLMVLAPPCTALLAAPHVSSRGTIALALAAIWAVRLAAYITRRHWGHEEDRRYRAIRRRNEPHFAWKSLYLVFGLQALLAWLVSLPVVASVTSDARWSWLDAIGIAVFLFGFVFEAVADSQLARFKARAQNRDRVMNKGVWRYSRHPNYFGEFCVWWGLWLVAAAAGAWWAIVSPLLMTILLLRVSGVTLLERDMATRRPLYDLYVARTSAFFPWKPRA